MKIRRRDWPAALILLPCLSIAIQFDLNTEPGPDSGLVLRATVIRDDSLLRSTSPPKPGVLEIGTKDAPVDGLDGKPHLGPFVDSSSELGRKKSPKAMVPKYLDSDPQRSNDGTGIDREKPVVENGVMNDPNRVTPKKGTTGTEGGVSEKEKERKAHELQTGEKRMKKPDPPKEMPLVPQAWHEKTDHEEPGLETKSTLSDRTALGDADRRKGAPGIEEKPEDVPDKAHDILHPSLLKLKDDSLDQTMTKHSIEIPSEPSPDQEGIHDLVKWDSLAGSFSSIAATEIGDKTFIVAALMAMRHPRLLVLSAAYSALLIMTILSGIAGHALGAMISKRWAALVAALLFLVFGAKSIIEGYLMSPNQGVSEEIEEVRAELEEKEVDMARKDRQRDSISPYLLESGLVPTMIRSRSRSRLPEPRRSPSSSPSSSPRRRPSIASAIAGLKNLVSLLLSPAWVETFSMTFIGELGDRSQIATVAMAAGQEYIWVMIGSGLAHFVCTSVAVLGGSVLAGRVSMRKVTIAGGAIFVGFGLYTLMEAKRYWY